MNTQAHILLAATLLCRTANAGPILPSSLGRTVHHARVENLAVIIGALLPDASLFFMFAQARLRGIDHEVIWGELYFSPFWQQQGALTNSIPVYILLSLLGFLGLRYYRHLEIAARSLMLLSLAALAHCLSDLPLHVDDGHPHFWPFSNWVFVSPVSYWDSNHYAQYWRPLEISMALICAVVLWRRFAAKSVRFAVVLLAISYPAMMFFWFSAMG